MTLDIANCAKEPIHIPGAIQPHGYFIGITPENTITRISQNFLDDLQLAITDVLNRAITECPLSLKTILEACGPLKVKGDNTQVEVKEKLMQATCVSSGTETYLDFEPNTLTLNTKALAAFQDALLKLSTLTNEHSICDNLALMLKEVTGYDRVMVYKFNKDFSGSVVAEARDKNLESFFGLHYPESDIPPQARALYKKNLTRLIVDTKYKPSFILSTPGIQPADLSFSQLRSISPIHIEYMKNMGVRASFTVSIIINNELWGLASAHHYSTSRYISPGTRKLAESLTLVATQLISSIESRQQLEIRSERNTHLQTFHNALNSKIPLKDAFTLSSGALLGITQSTGAIAQLGKNRIQIGSTPQEDALESFFAYLDSKITQEGGHTSDTLYYTDQLPARF